MAASGLVYRKIKGPHLARLNLHKFSNQVCGFKGYKCPQLCIDGFGYCIRHILEDESAPFERCCFVYPFSTKQCPLAAPRNEYSESFCPEHFNKLQRNRSHAGKTQPPVSAEKLLTNLSHYVRLPQKRLRQNSESEEIDVEGLFQVANPFVDINAVAVNASKSSILDYCSESDSDVDATIVGRTISCKDEDSSDAESIDSAEEDPLKFASVLTNDELISRAKTKTMRLKNLYTEQLRRLTHVLHERRRDYLVNLQKEKETNCSIAEQSKNTVKEQKLAEKVKQYNHYRKRYGVEAVLRKKMLDKRALSESNSTTRIGNKCIYTEGGVKCCVRTLPSSKYCTKHILEEKSQVLFRPCGFVKGDDVCKESLPGIEPCVYHLDIPSQHISYNTALSSEDDEELKQENSPFAKMKEEMLTDHTPMNIDIDLGLDFKHEIKEELALEANDLLDQHMAQVSCQEISVCEEVITTACN